MRNPTLDGYIGPTEHMRKLRLKRYDFTFTFINNLHYAPAPSRDPVLKRLVYSASD